MSPQGTAAYNDLTDLPPQVERAVSIAQREGFANSCRPDMVACCSRWRARQERRNTADPQALLRPGGTVVIDDLTPATDWPPRFDGQVDEARMHWLRHAD